MIAAIRRRPTTDASEGADAFRRVVLGLTAAVGAMVAGIGAATGQPMLMAALPTGALLLALATRRAAGAGWAGVAVWLVLLPSAQDEAILAPLAMIALCLAIAVSPERLLAWIGREIRGRPPGDVQAAEGWIEEDPFRIG